jgi:protein-tyrosine phosphatase
LFFNFYVISYINSSKNWNVKTPKMYRDPQSYVVSMDEIVPGIYVGNEAASQDVDNLRANRIGAIVNCTKHIKFPDIDIPKFRVPVNDPGLIRTMQQSDMQMMFLILPQVLQFIHEHHKKNKRILIHCHAGMQRSACVCAAYICRYIIYPNIVGGSTPTSAHKRDAMNRAITITIANRPIAFDDGRSINYKPVLDKFIL